MEGVLTYFFQNLKRPVPDMPEQKTYGEDCAACDQEEELYKETGKLPNDWNRPHSGHTHTLDGKRSSRMGKWVQEVAANTQQRATHLEGCEEILGTNFKELLPRLGPGTVNRVQLLATRQKVCQARSHASVQFLEFSAQDLNARISRHYQSLCEQFFGVPHPIWIMSDSKVALSLMNSPLQGFGFRTNILHRLLSIQAVTSRRDTLLFHVEGAHNASDYLTKFHANSLPYTITSLQVGEFLHRQVKGWPVSPAANHTNYELSLIHI